MMSRSTVGPLVGLLLIACLISSASAARTADWKPRSIYQTMTDRFARTDGSTTSPCNTKAGLYCGGTWRGTIDRLDYIQGMGFDAVMISPIIENVEGQVEYGEAYHGYWPLNLNNLNSHFGTHQDLLDLSDALHSRGMYFMMDTVINNMAYITNGSDPATDVDYSVFTPFNNADYFHPYCTMNWSVPAIAQKCNTGDDKVALPDLFTEHADVQQLLIKWANDAIKTYSIDGLRIDAAKHVNPDFLRKFSDGVDTFMTGEVLEGAVSIMEDYQSNYINSLPNYPVYFQILAAFTNGTTPPLAKVVEDMRVAVPDVNAMASFSENHDKARIASYNDDMSIAKNVLVFTMLFDGIPMIYQGQEQHLKGDGVPHNREAIWLTKYDTEAELYKLIAKLNRIRSHAGYLGSDYFEDATHPIYQGSSELAFTKGVQGRQVVMVLSNQPSTSGRYDLDLTVSYNAGTEVMDVLNCNNYTVDNQGMLRVDMDKGEPRVFFPTKYMEGSGLCGYSDANITLEMLKTHRTSMSAGTQLTSGTGVATFLLAVVTSIFVTFL